MTLAAIRRHILRHVTPPTIREIVRLSDGVQSSTSTTNGDLKGLIRRGELVRTGDGPNDYTIPEVWSAVQALRETK
jgi:hypothetical protein